MRSTNAENTRSRGLHAERIAADYLEAHGYTIVERNFRCKLGEIDIIARHNGDLVFVEVRSRHSPGALDPVYSVDFRKRHKIIRAAQVYLSGRFAQVPVCRFDVVLVTRSEPSQVEVICDAFGLD